MYQKLLADFWHQHRGKALIFIIVTAAILPVESIGLSTFTSRIVSQVQDKNFTRSRVLRSIIYIAIIYATVKLLGTIQHYLEAVLDSYLVRDVRDNMFQAFIDKNKQKYQEVELGKLVSYFNIIPHAYQDLIYRLLKYVVPLTLAIIILIGYFFYVDVRLGLCVAAIMMAVVIVFVSMIRRCIQDNITRLDQLHQNNEDIQDKMSNLFSVLVNNQDGPERTSNLAREDGYRQKSLRSELRYVRLITVSNVILIASLVGVLALYFKLFRTANSRQRPRLITSFLVFFYYISYVNSAKVNYVDMVTKFGIIHSYEKSLFPPNHSQTVSEEHQETDFIRTGKITVQDVTFGYGDRLIHQNLNMTLYPNTINIIRGHSGQGKTTLIKLILGFYPVNSGSIRIDGVEVGRANPEYIRSQTSMVTQDVKLFNTNLYNNIRYGNETVSREQVDKTIESMGLYQTVFRNLPKRLDTQVGANGNNLSNGQRQVTLLLRALIQNRKLLVLDEPTASLDPGTKKTVLDVIRRISRDKTTIIITHDRLKLRGNLIELPK